MTGSRRTLGTDVALVVVDAQYEFFNPRNAAIGRMQKAFCLPGVRRLVVFARERRWPIIFVRTRHGGRDELPRHLRSKDDGHYCIGGPGAEIVGGLIADSDVVLTKQRYSGFDGTALADHLASIECVVLAGIAADCCILHTGFDCVRHDKRVVIPYQAVSATKADQYSFALRTLAKSVGSIVDLSELIEQGEFPLQEDDVGRLTHVWHERCRELCEPSEDEYRSRFERDADGALELVSQALALS